jgi:hypothetical protein
MWSELFDTRADRKFMKIPVHFHAKILLADRRDCSQLLIGQGDPSSQGLIGSPKIRGDPYWQISDDKDIHAMPSIVCHPERIFSSNSQIGEP